MITDLHSHTLYSDCGRAEQSLFRRFAPYKSDQQHQQKDEQTARLFCTTKAGSATDNAN